MGHEVSGKNRVGYASDGVVLYVKESLEMNQSNEVMVSTNNMKSAYNKRHIKEKCYSIGFIWTTFWPRRGYWL